MNVNTMTREQMIAHIRSVSKDWGLKPPKNLDRCSDQALRKCVKRMFADGEKLAEPQS